STRPDGNWRYTSVNLMIYHRTRSIQDLQPAGIVGDFSVIDGHLGVKGQRPLRGQGAEALAGVPLPGQRAGVEEGPPSLGSGGNDPNEFGTAPRPNGIFDALSYYKWFGVGNRDVNDYFPRLPDKLHHMLVSFPSTLFQRVAQLKKDDSSFYSNISSTVRVSWMI
ncbi:hypothetical protein Tco_1396132, partial [Tanacetum coccineum]